MKNLPNGLLSADTSLYTVLSWITNRCRCDGFRSGADALGRFRAFKTSNHWRRRMARKPATRAEFVLFDVLYEDGSQRSNRRVPSGILGGLDGDAPARGVIEEQDRLIAEKSGRSAPAVKSVQRSRGK